VPQLSTHLEPRVSPWGWPDGLVHNSRILRTRFLRTRFYKLLRVSTRTPFKRRKRYSPTSRKARVLVVQASIAAYLQDSLSSFFSNDSLNSRKQRIHTDKLRTRATFTCPQPRIPFFWFTSSGVHKQLVLFEVLAPTSLVLQGSHVQRQYRKRTTLRSKSRTIKRLLYAPDPHNREKGTLSDQPRLSRVSSTALLCCWGCSRSKMWRPLWLTLRCMPYGRGTLKIPLQSICDEEGPHYRFEQSARKPSSNKQQSTYSRVWISLGDTIPGLNCVAWQSLSLARKCHFENFVSKKGMNRVHSNGRSQQKPLAKGGKGKICQ
jgi:hypothetical protein